MWGVILGLVALSIAADCEARIRRLQDRLWESERTLQELRAKSAGGE